MNPQLRARVEKTWADHFHLPLALMQQPGTTLYPNPERSEASYIVLWRVGEHVIVETDSPREAEVRAVVDQLAPGQRITPEDFVRAWGEDTLDLHAGKFYMLDETTFCAFTPDSRYTVRQLTAADAAAFEAFLAQCSDDDRDEGDVAIDHDTVFGALDGERIVAAASTYEWRGFTEIGVLTDPAYRGQGLGKAVVSICAQHHAHGERVVIYQHDVVNLGSQAIARGVCLAYYMQIEAIFRRGE